VPGSLRLYATKKPIDSGLFFCSSTAREICMGKFRSYLAPRCPPYSFVLNSMLIFDTSFGSMSAPGPHLIHNSYFISYQHTHIISRGLRGVVWVVSGVSEVSAEERIVPSITDVSIFQWRIFCRGCIILLLAACARVLLCSPWLL
jgi:hypothetical protein